MIPKPKRIVDKKLLAEVRKARCCVAGCTEHAEVAHMKSRGSGGDDVSSNVSPLCRCHHAEQHAVGWVTFRAKHPEVRSWQELMEDAV
jgi:hypothetical protein